MKIINGVLNFLIRPVEAAVSGNVNVNPGFIIPSFADIITFAIRMFFFVAGLLALIYLILGAVAWITSAGNKENVSKAQEKIQAAVVGLVILVGVIALMAVIEQVIFNQKFCLGLTCPINLSSFKLL